MFEVGDKIRNYEILARLKSGGMGTLLLARRVGAAGFSQNVAIKVIHPHLSSENSFVKAFVNEALLSARISHPNVVHVEELGEENGIYFLVMEYVHGCTLAQLLTELGHLGRMLAPEAAVAIALRALDGLHAAHETKDHDGKSLGLVHRDVSPQNILISVAGEIKLIDFGIAKARDADSTTAEGTLKGKLRYMSPEQAYGREIDRRADVYSLGIVLWEMLTRKRLFQAGKTLALLDKVRNPKILPPGAYAPHINAALSNAVMAALNPRADERPPTARAFRRLLIEAMPSALEVEGDQLSELFDAMDKGGEGNPLLLVPGAASPARADSVPERRGEILKTLTITAEQLGVDSQAFEEDIDIEEGSVRQDTSVPSAPEPPARRRTRVWIYAAGLVASVIAGLFAQWLISSSAPLPAPVREAPAPEPQPPPPPVEATIPVSEQVAPAEVEPPAEARKPARARPPKKKSKAPKDPDSVPIMEEVPF